MILFVTLPISEYTVYAFSFVMGLGRVCKLSLVEEAV